MKNDEYVSNDDAIMKLCETVRTTLGPFGASKLIVDSGGTVTTSSSGSKVFEALDVETPTTGLLQDEANEFQKRHADGTATFVALVGALLNVADDLLEQGVHPTMIERGYLEATEIATDHAQSVARDLDTIALDAVPKTALTDVRDPQVRDHIGKSLVDVVVAMRKATGTFAPGDVYVHSRLGRNVQATEIVHGLVLDRDLAHRGMPRSVGKTGVAALPSTIDFKQIGHDADQGNDVRATLDVNSFKARNEIRRWERDEFETAVRSLRKQGCQFVVTKGAITDRVKTYLAEHDIIGIQRVSDEEMRLLGRATGASVVPDLDHVTESTLGQADVSIVRKAGRDLLRIDAPEGSSVHTLFVRAPDPRSVDEFERSVESALAALATAIDDRAVVPGGGAIEAGVALAVRRAARSVGGREQLAMDAFGDAITTIPRTLARNAGMDAVSTLADLRAAHDEGQSTVGVDSVAGSTCDVFTATTIVEPLSLKTEELVAATELVIKLVRIDTVLSASDLTDDGNNDHSDIPRNEAS